MKPDREEVLRMAREAGLIVSTGKCDMGPPENKLERLYALAYEAGARAEREECAKAAESLPDAEYLVDKDSWDSAKEDCAAAIRARTT